MPPGTARDADPFKTLLESASNSDTLGWQVKAIHSFGRAHSP